MQYLRDVSEMSCGTTAIMQMRLQQDSSQQDSSNHRNVQIFGRYFFIFTKLEICSILQFFSWMVFKTDKHL